MAGAMNMNRASILFAGLLCLVAIHAQRSDAFQFSVGSNGWTVPSDPSSNIFNEWAERSRFQIGDSLVFVYKTNEDSVLYVNEDDYKNCNNESFIAKYVDGHTVFNLNHSGPFHFISGNKDNCLKNEKVVVVVLADRSNRNSTQTSPPPSPSSSPSPPAPSPAPAGESSPSPPAGTVEINPTPAPSTEASPPPSSASSVFIGFASSIAAFLASSALLVL